MYSGRSAGCGIGMRHTSRSQEGRGISRSDDQELVRFGHGLSTAACRISAGDSVAWVGAAYAVVMVRR